MPSETVKTFLGSSRFVSLSQVYVSPSVLPSNNLITLSFGVMASLAAFLGAASAAQAGAVAVRKRVAARARTAYFMQLEKRLGSNTSSNIRTSMHLSFDS